MKKQTVPSYDELLEQQGGYGRYQKIAFFYLLLLQGSAGYVLYNIPYLLLYPVFNCTQKQPDGQWLPIPSDDKDCKPEYFCDHKDTV